MSFTSVRYRTQPLRREGTEGASVYDRFQRVPGADQESLAQAHVVLVGCGGLGGEVGHGLVRKGIGRLTMFDHDIVELSNLPRQRFFPEDIGRNKAMRLADRLRREATGCSVLEGHPRSFQEALGRGVRVDGDIAVVGVDNNETRVATARHYWSSGTPVIFLAVDRRAARGYVFVQRSQPGAPCFVCLFPDAGEDRRVHGCAGASVEILKIVAGIVLYALDSLLMERPRPWNYKQVFLDRGADGHRTVQPRLGCSLCGGGSFPARGQAQV